MLIENPTIETDHADAPFCAIRKRKPDGTPNVGGHWIEPMGSILPYISDQQKYEVVFYQSGDTLPY